MSDSLRVLAIHAHPDDIEFQCSGTLARLKEKGCSIAMATMTPGDCGSAVHPPEEIAAIRRAEAKKSADLMGADYYCLEFRDLSIFIDDQSRRKVTEILRIVNPDIVITAPPVDYMCDHEATSSLVRDACFCAPAPNYKTGLWDPAPATDKIPHLYFVDPIEGTDAFGNTIEPEFIVDISSTFPLKKEMVSCHESQRAWLKKQHGMDEYVLKVSRWSEERGQLIDAEYGEGFRQYKGHPYPEDNIILELLGK